MQKKKRENGFSSTKKFTVRKNRKQEGRKGKRERERKRNIGRTEGRKEETK
jgi:hypothetical protein